MRLSLCANCGNVLSLIGFLTDGNTHKKYSGLLNILSKFVLVATIPELSVLVVTSSST